MTIPCQLPVFRAANPAHYRYNGLLFEVVCRNRSMQAEHRDRSAWYDVRFADGSQVAVPVSSIAGSPDLVDAGAAF